MCRFTWVEDDYPKYVELEMGFLLRWVNDKSEFSLIFIYYASDQLSVTPPPPHTHTHTHPLLKNNSSFHYSDCKSLTDPWCGQNWCSTIKVVQSSNASLLGLTNSSNTHKLLVGRGIETTRIERKTVFFTLTKIIQSIMADPLHVLNV